MVRLGFTMIELIFAIVGIGISIMSLPTMTNVINNGMENNLNQEAIFAASAKLMDATSGYWDENSMQDINKSHISRVINIDDDDSDPTNDCGVTTKLRPGHINQPFHRRCLDDLTTSPTNTKEDNIYDLDDYEHTDEKIFITYSQSSSGYKQDYKSSIDVTPNSSDANIKEITITIKDESGNTVTVLKTYSANIGETEYFKRTF
jgi:type II secretory pathway pseudopilin PulG